MKRATLCADDYAQSEAISEAIVALAELAVVDWVSCITLSPDWPSHAQDLTQRKNSAVRLGLHLCLTPYRSDRQDTLCQSLREAMTRSVLRQWDRKALLASIHAQCDAFEKAVGHAPHFIDGHQHVQEFEGVREALLEVYRARYPKDPPFLRRSATGWNPKLPAWDKQCILAWMAWGFPVHELEGLNISHNQRFAGLYHASDRRGPEQLFPQFFAQAGPGPEGLVMCHPSIKDERSDPMGYGARRREYEYFKGGAI